MLSTFKTKLKSILKKAVVASYKIMCKVLPVRKNIVLFMSNMGKNYSGNPRAIFELLNKADRKKSVKGVWAFTKLCLSDANVQELPRDCKIVTYGGLKYYYYLAVAGKWVFDTRQEPYLVKRKKCVYIQTWHGTPLKKLGIDISEMNMSGELSSKKQENTDELKQQKLADYYASFRQESAKWDYLVAQNDFSAHTFRRCFDYQGSMLKTGYPRNDILFSSKRDEIAEQVKGKLGIDTEKKVILYAPTWRDDQYLEGGWYGYDSPLDFESLEKSLRDSCRIVVKLHYLVHLKKGDIPEKCLKSGFVTLCGNDIDIARLYLAADLLITDYSSVMFDYALTKRPMIFYAYDLEQYRDKLRGFYFDLCQEAPGPICQTQEKLVDAIREFLVCSQDKSFDLSENYRIFIEKYNGYDDGHASERIAQLILNK